MNYEKDGFLNNNKKNAKEKNGIEKEIDGQKKDDDSTTSWQSESQQSMNVYEGKHSLKPDHENQKFPEINFDEGSDEIHYESFQEKLPKLKKQRNHKLIRKVSVIFGCFFIVLLFMLYFISPLSKLEDINISGNKFLSSEKILKVSNLVEGEGLWSQYFLKRHVKENIKHMSPRVESVQIKLSGLNGLKIRVHEYSEVAYEEDEKTNEYHPILSTGKLMNESFKQSPKNLLILKKFNGSKHQISEVIEQYNRLHNSLRDLITVITLTPTLTNPDLTVLSMKDGNEVKVSFEDISERLNYYSKVSKNMPEPGVVDMEIGVYSYPFSKKEEEEKRGNDSDKSKGLSDDKENKEGT
jgi:cell division protein FtsQ